MERENYTLVDLLRHGACEGGNIFRGVTDVPLTKTGWGQMSKAIEQQSGWDRVITSPLQRCQKFAQQHADQLNLPLSTNEEWREINFGIWEGQEIKQIRATNPETVDRYFSDPGSVTPDGGESMAAARERVINAWRNTLSLYPREHLLIVQHAGTIRLLLTHIMDSPLSAATRFDVGYASMTRIRVYHHNDQIFPVIVAHYPGTSQFDIPQAEASQSKASQKESKK